MAGMERYAIYSDNCQGRLNRRIQSDFKGGEILRSSEGGRLPPKAFEDDGEFSSGERCTYMFIKFA